MSHRDADRAVVIEAALASSPRTDNRDRSATAAYWILFVLYGGAVIFWLLLGVGPSLARGVPSLLRIMHGWALGDDWVAHLARRIASASEASYAGKGPAILYYLFSGLNLALALLLAKLRPRDRVARLLALGMIGTAAAFNLPSHSFTDVFGGQAVKFLHVGFHFISGVAYMYAVVLFPDGKLVPRWSKWPVRALYLLGALGITLAAAVLVYRGSTSFAAHFVVFFGLLIPIVGVASQTYRYRHAATEQERQQARLFRWALLPAFAAGVVFLLLSIVATRSPGLVGQRLASLEEIVIRVFPVAFAIIPLVLFFGIVRYRLLDIDLVVSKTLLYGALAAFISLIYVAIVVGIGSAVGGRNSLALSILAATIVAVGFQPVRERAQRVANRLVYGERFTPYEALVNFSERMAASLSVEEVLPRMAEAAARGVGAIRSRVRVFLPAGDVRSVSWPDEASGGTYDRTITVFHHGEALGDLWVGKPPGEPLTPAQESLLADLASEAGLALRNVRLTVELQARLEELSAQAAELLASRQRIVAAQDAAAKRLERNIHDGAQQQLVALAVKLGLAEGLVDKDPASTRELLSELKTQTYDALHTLRDLARGIYPPLLADQGLVAALRAHVGKSSLPARVDAVNVGRYSTEVEAALYFCCLEALQNASKYASNSPVLVHLEEADGELALSVSDGGAGFDSRATQLGSGLQNMTDRLAALGGTLEVRSAPGSGTLVTGRIPAQSSSP